MTRSLFSMSPFRPAYGLSPARRTLGQEGFIDDLTGLIGDIAPLLEDLDSGLSKLPVGVAGPFTARRDECLRKSTLEKYKCLYDLFQDIKAAIRDEEEKAAVPTTPRPTSPPASSFPIVPVVIGGIAAAAVLYAVFKG